LPYPIQEKLVVAVASSALFDLRESDEIFRTRDLEEYRAYQRAHEQQTLHEGPAFPFIRRLLNLNVSRDDSPVEVILLSRNDPDTGLRVMTSIREHSLGVTRAAFLNGEDPWHYMGAFNAVLFLSSNASDVRGAIRVS
jgi:5'-nucleotidase